MNNTRWKGLEEIVELDPAGESAVSRPFLDLFPAVSQAGWSNHLHLHRTANTRAARGVAAAGQIAGLRVHCRYGVHCLEPVSDRNKRGALPRVVLPALLNL